MLVVIVIGWALAQRYRPGDPLAKQISDLKQSFLAGLLLGLAIFSFQLPVLAAWTRLDHYVALGGLIPYSDARDYYFGATHFLFRGELDEWNSRRPLNALLLAVRLALCGNDFRCALLLQAAMAGAACFAFARASRVIVGGPGAVLMFAMLMKFSAEHSPSTNSELLGLTFGALGGTLVLKGVAQSSLKLVAAGTAMIAVGLGARAGAFFVLPALVFWAGWFFRRERRFSAAAAAWPCVVIVVAFTFNALVLRTYSDGSPPSGNFGFTLYGLSQGGTGWPAIYTDYPESKAMTNIDQNNFAFAKAMESIKSRPHRLAFGTAQCFARYCKGMTLFCFSLSRTGFIPLDVVIAALLLYGIFMAWRRKLFSREIQWLITGVFIACAVSGAIIWQDGGSRVFAATHPLFLLFLAVGIVGLSARSAPLTALAPVLDSARFDGLSKAVLAASVLLCLTAAFGPKLAHKSFPARIDETQSGEGLRAWVGPGVPHLNVAGPHDPSAVSFAPQATYEGMNHSLQTFAGSDTIDASLFRGPRTVILAWGRAEGIENLFWISAPLGSVPDQWQMKIFKGRVRMHGWFRYFIVED